ncbi:hypothetical protein CBS101457_000206 [Exobasidium rhododendri]|nr:hypothetical protein CBS101457_000206 [Exobasidium rhododendri]
MVSLTMFFASRSVTIAFILLHYGSTLASPAPSPMLNRSKGKRPAISKEAQAAGPPYQLHADTPRPTVQTRDFLSGFGMGNMNLDHHQSSHQNEPGHYDRAYDYASTVQQEPFAYSGHHAQVSNPYYAQDHSSLSYYPPPGNIIMPISQYFHQTGQSVEHGAEHTPQPSEVQEANTNEDQDQDQDMLAAGRTPISADLIRMNSEGHHPYAYNLRQLQAYRLQEIAQQALYPSFEEQSNVAPENRYIVPIEFPYQFDSTIQYFNDPKAKIYYDLTKDQRTVIADRIRQVRPYNVEAIRKKLVDHMTRSLAVSMLGDDVVMMDEAINRIYPIDLRKERATFTPWMMGLSNSERRLVIKKFAEATQQRSDELLDLFLESEVSPRQARNILQGSMDDCRAMAERDGLYVVKTLRSKPWQQGVGYLQRGALLQRMMFYGVKEDYCYKILVRPFVPDNYGMVMLRADNGKFQEIMNWLRYKPRGSPP